MPEAKAGKNRVHLDLATQSGAHQAAEVERLRGLGAVPADIGQRDVRWTVLADPEGNEFCVLEPRPVYLDTGPVAAVVAGCRDPAAVAGLWELATGWVLGDSLGRVSIRRGIAAFPGRRRAVSGAAAVGGTQDGQEPDAPGRGPVRGRRSGGGGRGAAGRPARGRPTWARAGSVAVLADPEGSEFCVLSPR